MVFKQQLQTQGKRQTPYSRVTSRINSGVPKKTIGDGDVMSRSPSRSAAAKSDVGSPR